MTAAAIPAAPALNRPMIIASVMLGTILTALDTTIANVALPHMAGTVSASQDQIAWILTSYIIANAICTPITGWLSGRMGRKRLMIVATIGFIAASALCGAAQNLEQIVLFRVLQGLFAAPLMPLSQTLILDIFSPSELGPVMAIWSIGVAAAPIAGPVLGGWLTDEWSWRWVFYINLPIGVLCAIGMWRYMPDTAADKTKRLDITGFAYLSIAIISLQLMFDRGQGQGWFSSPEIVIEAALAFLGLWFSLVHSFTSRQPFLPLPIFRDINFVTCSLMVVIVGLVVLSVTAMLPSMLQTVYGYSARAAGALSMPRGIGSVISMLMVGRLVGRVDTRILLIIGLIIFSISFYMLSMITLDSSATGIGLCGLIQGLGSGFVFVPLATAAFGTLAPEMRSDASAFFILIRNLAGSAGISIMLAMLATFSAATRNQLITPYTPGNSMIQPETLPAPMSITDPTGIAILSSQIDLQATMLAYTQVFHIMFLVTLLAIPCIFLMRTPSVAVATPATAMRHED